MLSAAGPGIGTAVGIKMAELENAARVQSSNLGELRQQLVQLQRQALFDEAFTLAAAELTQLILEELRVADAGNPGARNLSNPSNASDRNKFYVQRAGKLVYLLSKGRDRMGATERANFIAAQPLN